MRYGHVVLARRTDDWTSHITAYLTNGYFSHAFVTTLTIDYEVLCIEAELSGITATLFNNSYKNVEISE